MAVSEVAVSLAIVRLHDLLSNSKNIIAYQTITDQISDSISNPERILSTRKHAEVNDDHNQETPEGRLLRRARGAELIAEEVLVKLFRHQMSKSQKGRFTKVFDSVRFYSEMNWGSARKKMAEDFMTEVGSLFSEFTSSRPPAKSLPDKERASSSSSSKRNRENTRQRVESDIVGCDEEDRKKLKALLTDHDNDSNLRVISVVSKHACGKTALVRSVFSDLDIKHHFDCRAWVRVTDRGVESDRMKNLLVDILKQTPLRDQAKDLECKQEEQLSEMLHKLLMNLRYLIVVDNLHEASLINKLLVPFVDSSKGSRVIVTTTNEKMQKFADPWTPDLRLLPHLTSTECKKSLLSITDDSQSKMTILKCNGPPPAFSLLGGLLSAVEESDCEALIDRLGGLLSAAEVSDSEALIDRLGDRPPLDAIMSLCFDELPYMTKPRVLYMALFPEESEVPTRRLFRRWAAEGLLAEVAADGSVGMRSAEDCFHELESRNFIHVVRQKLDGSARSCRMPAFLHKFFCQKAEESGLLQIPRSCDSVSNKESRGMDAPNAEQSAQNQQKQAQNTANGHHGYKVRCLQSFTSFNTRKLGVQAREIEDLLKSPTLEARPDLLRVLDLEGTYKPVLPESFGKTLLNLRYLGLRWTALDSIPESVGNLLLLETLDLKHTNITKVTSAIWNAKNLQHLYLSEASFDKPIPHHMFSPNTKLETLWGLFIDAHDNPMVRVLENLKSLKKLGVTCRPGAADAVKECISKLDGLESLRFRSRDLLGQPASLGSGKSKGPKSLSNLYLLGSFDTGKDLQSVLPNLKELTLGLLPNLKVLTLSMSELGVNPMEVLRHLENLIVLRLLARSFTGTELQCQAGFTKLRVLKLWMLQELKVLIVGKGAMPNLKELEIKQCQKLEAVTGLDSINNLKSVCLTQVKKDLAEELADNGKRRGVRFRVREC